MTRNDICARSFRFALAIVHLCRRLDQCAGVERTLGRQLLRSGTSIGANIEEAQAAQSRPDFIHKMSIAAKEARETLYWLRLLEEAECRSRSAVEPLRLEAGELVGILTAIVKNTRSG